MCCGWGAQRALLRCSRPHLVQAAVALAALLPLLLPLLLSLLLLLRLLPPPLSLACSTPMRLAMMWPFTCPLREP